MNSRQRALNWPYPRRRRFQKELQDAATRWFADKGFPADKRYPYILDRWDNWPKNIILPEVSDLIKKVRDERDPTDAFPLHRYIHHGLSSQAMLFNLIGPMMVSQDYSPLKVALGNEGIKYPTGNVEAQFEVEDRQVFAEDSGQPTSLDLALRGDDPADALYIECKLSEAKFGGCSVFADADCDGRNPSRQLDSCYLHHIGRLYWSLLEKHGFLDTPVGTDSSCVLVNHYQFFREFLFAVEKGGRFVLLCDERNPAFYCKHETNPRRTRGLMEYLQTLIPQHLQSKIAHVTIQQVMSSLRQVGGHDHWMDEFERKYGLTSF